MSSTLAISLLDNPFTTCANTPRSRSVSVASRSANPSAAAGGTPVLRIAPQRVVDAVEQLLLAIGLLHEVHGAGLDCLDRNCDVAVTAEKYDRDARAHRVQLVLQCGTAHMRHAHIEHEASWLLGIEAVAKLLRGAKRGRAQADGRYQFGDRVEHRLVVVDNEYGGFRHIANLPLSWPAG